ncbi:MAG: hypothetical protein IPN90_04560 [Elusimicrobia bacterium]|nr:hypothetical protein [Elusimicrobiota bacterium]
MNEPMDPFAMPGAEQAAEVKVEGANASQVSAQGNLGRMPKPKDEVRLL